MLLLDQAPPTLRFVIGPTGRPEAILESTSWLDRWASVLDQFETQGVALLRLLSVLIQAAIWILAPLLTADCLSSERRQGTLGLLLLTPIRPLDVVVSKFLVHGGQAVCVFLAGLPVLMLPVLVGGVTWLDGLDAMLTNASILMVALTAGVVASSLWDGPRAVLIGAASLALAFGLSLSAAGAAAFGCSRILYPATATPWTWGTFLADAALHWDSGWSQLGLVLREPRRGLLLMGTAGTVGPAALMTTVVGCLFSLLVSLLSLAWVAHRVRKAVQERPLPPAATAPPGNASLALAVPRLRRRTLEWVRTRHPFLWVELRTWRGHVVPWLCLVLIFPWEASRSLSPGDWGFATALGAPLWCLAGIVVLAAASCLASERASGGLELLLTVPKGDFRLVSGKFQGLGLQALPALILILGIEAAIVNGLWDESTGLGNAVARSTTLVVAVLGRTALASAAGAYFGLRLRGLLPAWLGAMATLLLVAHLAMAASQQILRPPSMASEALLPFALSGLLEGLTGMLAGYGVFRSLHQRQPVGVRGTG